MNITAKGDGDDEAHLMMTFPWLLKQHEANRSNIVCKLRRYSVWQHGGVAEAEVETDTGQRITAIMPYFVADYRYCVRGIRFEGILAGFARDIKVLKPSRPHHHCNPVGEDVPTNHRPTSSPQREVAVDDDFSQQFLPRELTGAGFGMVGRVRSYRTLTALDVNLLVVEIECSQLDHPLRIYICAARVKDQLAIGDTVEVTGWLYIDLSETVDDLTRLMLAYPDSAPKDVRTEPWGRGVPVYVSMESSNKQKGANKQKTPEPNWRAFGRFMLQSCKGVLRVEACSDNPLGANYLVHTGDQVLKYRMVVAKDDETPCRHYPGVETFLLRLQTADHGYNLSWEDLPEFAEADSSEAITTSDPS